MNLVRRFLLLLFLTVNWQIAFALNSPIVINNYDDKESLSILQHSYIWNDTAGVSTFTQAQQYFATSGKNQPEININAPVHWLKFSVIQANKPKAKVFLTIPFTDIIDLYISYDGGKTYKAEKAGDLIPLHERSVKNGQMVFFSFDIYGNKNTDILLRLESTTGISQQFRAQALKAIRIYSNSAYVQQFQNSRIFQAMFYGALAIMMFYNLFLSLTLSSRSYFYYVIFLLFISVFLASNSGYIYELLLPANPRYDLYIRFLSTPLLLISYILFSTRYLRLSQNMPAAFKAARLLIFLLFVLLAMMLFGAWKLGRNLNIIVAVLVFIYLFAIAILVYRKGFSPARYYIIANALLLFGGIVFALSRFNLVMHNPFTQYSVQIAVLLQVALLSLGLADRINLVRKNLAAQVLENERLKLKNEQEQKYIIEKKNKELQTVNTELETFIYRTSHDIRGPLARLLGLCNLGLSDVEEENALEYLQKIEFTAQTLDNILRRLNTMHDIAHIDFHPEPIDFKAIINEIIAKLNPKDIEVTVEVPQYIVFESDQRFIRFILYNLIENAFKFTDTRKEKQCVEINIQKLDNKINIHVIDNGIGISADEAPYLFQMFSTIGKKYENTGLGLYKVKRVLDKYGGAISLINDTENLTHFLIELPLGSRLTNTEIHN